MTHKAWLVEVNVYTAGCVRPEMTEAQLAEIGAMVLAFQRGMAVHLGKHFPLADTKPVLSFQHNGGSWRDDDQGVS